MGFIDPQSPVFNTVIFYILIIGIIWLLKPNFLYCNKRKHFRQFGCNEGQTIITLPVFGILASVTIYLIFLTIEIINSYIQKNS